MKMMYYVASHRANILHFSVSEGLEDLDLLPIYLFMYDFISHAASMSDFNASNGRMIWPNE